MLAGEFGCAACAVNGTCGVFLLMSRCRFTIFARFDKIPKRIQALDGVIPEGLPYECDT